MTASTTSRSVTTSPAPTAASGRCDVVGDWSSSPLREVDAVFNALTCDPNPLS